MKSNITNQESVKNKNKDIDGIVYKLCVQNENKKGLLVACPTTTEFICTCAMNCLHPEMWHNDGTVKKSVLELNGWVVVTTKEKASSWSQIASKEQDVYKASLDRKTSYYTEIPPFTVHTYDTLGMLRSYEGLDSRLLIVFEDAEHLIDHLRRDKTLKTTIRKCFEKTLLFTNNVSFLDLRELLLLTEPNDSLCKFPSSAKAISNKYESPKTSFVKLFKQNLVDPARKMMMHFLLVFFMVMNIQKMFTKSNEQQLNDKYRRLLHSRKQRMSRKTPNPNPKQKQTRQKQGGQYRTLKQYVSKKHHTQRKQKGGVLMIPLAISYFPYVFSGGLLFWMISIQEHGIHN